MEHTCSKCGAIVVDGTPFCPQCKAPQIRVLGFEVEAPHPETAATVESDPGLGTARPRLPVISSHSVIWHQALPSAAFGGVIAIAALFIPLAVWGPAYSVGGAAAVFIYRVRTRSLRLTPAMGAKIGAVSGGFGFAILAIVTVGTYVYHAEELRKLLSDAVSQMSARGSDPHAVQQALELLKTQEGLGAFVAFFLCVLLVIFVIASSLGGALCASWLRRR